MTLYECRACSGLFNSSPNANACPICGHDGRTVHYVNGDERKTNWYTQAEIDT